MHGLFFKLYPGVTVICLTAGRPQVQNKVIDKIPSGPPKLCGRLLGNVGARDLAPLGSACLYVALESIEGSRVAESESRGETREREGHSKVLAVS